MIDIHEKKIEMAVFIEPKIDTAAISTFLTKNNNEKKVRNLELIIGKIEWSAIDA